MAKKSCFIAISTVSGEIIQLFISESGWFSKGTELMYISNY